MVRDLVVAIAIGAEPINRRTELAVVKTNQPAAIIDARECRSVLDALQNHLMNPELDKVFCEEYTKHINVMRQTRNAHINRYKKELGKLAEAKQSIIEAIKNGIPASEVKDEFDRTIKRRDELLGYLDDKEETAVLLHPNMSLRYQKEINELREVLNDDSTRMRAADILRGSD